MFKIGDVIIIREDNPYSITTTGSIGTIIATSGSFGFIVKFDHLASNRYGQCDPGLDEDCYRIDSNHLDFHIKRTKEELVCLKIQAMNKRFEKRKEYA